MKDLAQTSISISRGPHRVPMKQSPAKTLPVLCVLALAIILSGCPRIREQVIEEQTASNESADGIQGPLQQLRQRIMGRRPGRQSTGQQRNTTPPPRVENAPLSAAAASPVLQLLGGQSTVCTDVPFIINGKDIGAKVAAYLGHYKDGMSPRFGADGEAEVTVNGSQEITVKFHPKTPYNATYPGHDNQYYLYVGLIPPWAQPGGGRFSGCGYGGAAPLPRQGRHLHFRGDFKWISSASNPPPGSGAGNTLLGGWLAYYFGANLNIVAIDDFSAGPPANPTSLAQSRYVCGPPPPNDWWHDLQWADWWNGSLGDKWYSFDIDITAAHQAAVAASSKPNCGRNLAGATSVQVKGLFVGPEYGVNDGGPSVFMLRNLRAEIG